MAQNQSFQGNQTEQLELFSDFDKTTPSPFYQDQSENDSGKNATIPAVVVSLKHYVTKRQVDVFYETVSQIASHLK